jgi:hypothetical protein
MALSPVHSISQLPKRSSNRTALHIHTTLQDRNIRSEKKGRGVGRGDVSRCVSTLAPAVTVTFDVTAKYRQRPEQARNVTA